MATALYTWKEVEIQLRGQYHDFVALVERFKEMNRPVQLREMKIDRDKGDFGEVLITATLRV